MEPVNNHVEVTPLKKGAIGGDGNEYVVVKGQLKYIEQPKEDDDEIAQFRSYDAGDIVIIEDGRAIKTYIDGREVFYVREDDIIARTYDGSKPDACDVAENGDNPGSNSVGPSVS